MVWGRFEALCIFLCVVCAIVVDAFRSRVVIRICVAKFHATAHDFVLRRVCWRLLDERMIRAVTCSYMC